MARNYIEAVKVDSLNNIWFERRYTEPRLYLKRARTATSQCRFVATMRALLEVRAFEEIPSPWPAPKLPLEAYRVDPAMFYEPSFLHPGR